MANIIDILRMYRQQQPNDMASPATAPAAPVPSVPPSSGMNPSLLPQQGTEQMLQAEGSPELNPIIRSIMQHFGMLNMLRNRAAQPITADPSATSLRG